MYKKTLLSTILALASMPLLAADYYVVVPTQAKGQVSEQISVKLNAATMPEGSVGSLYAGFDFNTVLQVTGDSDYDGSRVAWQVAEGALPAGLTLNPNGTVTGTPTTEVATVSVTVKATYRTATGQQDYVFQVITPTLEVRAYTKTDGPFWFDFWGGSLCVAVWGGNTVPTVSSASKAQDCVIDHESYRYRPSGPIRFSTMEGSPAALGQYYDISREKL